DCRLEALEVPPWLPRGQPSTLRLRAHNTGTATWRLRADKHVGVHLGWVIWDPHGVIMGADRVGQLDAEVPPGQSIDLTLALPALPGPGPYRVLADLTDEQHLWFFQGGAEPWEEEFEVRDEDTTPAGERGPADRARLAH